MDQRGRVITLSRYVGDEPTDYICTASYGNTVEIVPITPGQEHVNFLPIELGSPRRVYGSYVDNVTIKQVKARCEARVRSLEKQDRLLNGIFGRANSDDLEGARVNLERLCSLDGDLPVTRDEPTPAMDTRTSAMSAVFAEVYGGFRRPNLVGKMAFIEIPLAYDDDGSGEFIVVQQSQDSLYVVDTNSCAAGVRVYRMPFSDGDEHITILDSYEDDDFVREFIDRLDDMDTESYDTAMCDAAETVSRQLSRMLENKAKQTSVLDDLFGLPGLFFGPIGSVEPKQAEDRCHRAGCNAQCCGV